MIALDVLDFLDNGVEAGLQLVGVALKLMCQIVDLHNLAKVMKLVGGIPLEKGAFAAYQFVCLGGGAAGREGASVVGGVGFGFDFNFRMVGGDDHGAGGEAWAELGAARGGRAAGGGALECILGVG